VIVSAVTFEANQLFGENLLDAIGCVAEPGDEVLGRKSRAFPGVKAAKTMRRLLVGYSPLGKPGSKLMWRLSKNCSQGRSGITAVR
jgi:hypothetical protein